MPVVLPVPARRLLLATVAFAAAAGAAPAAAGTVGVADGRDVAPVVVSVGAQSAAHWMPFQHRFPAAPVRSTAVVQPPTTPTTTTTTTLATAPNLATEHSTSYTFMSETSPGDPIRWDACGTVHWVFNPANAPAGGLSAVESAVTRIAAATGLHFAYDGTSDAAPTGAYVDTQTATAGFRPLLVGWSSASASTLLANQPANLVGMDQTIWARPATGATHIVSGVIALNSAVTAPTSGAGSWFTFTLHELGHAVGLGHTTDPTQIMAPTIPAAATDYGSGDLAGLARVGGTC